MQQVSSVTALRRQLADCRQRGSAVILVPTMGNFHAGHLALVDEAKRMGGCVVTTIFVNPTQFVEGEDYGEYPRTLESDLEKLSELGVDIVFTPDVKEIYSGDLKQHTKVIIPDLDYVYCGKFRPGHFEGVATIVTKLFNIISPDHAIFGTKDYQQLIVIKRLVKDLSFPINVIGVETVREQDGLAMSSRNQYLKPEQRQRAPILYKTLMEMAEEIGQGNMDFEQLQHNACRKLTDSGFKTDYISICDAENLGRPSGGNLVILAAAWLGRARLIDNVAVQHYD